MHKETCTSINYYWCFVVYKTYCTINQMSYNKANSTINLGLNAVPDDIQQNIHFADALHLCTVLYLCMLVCRMKRLGGVLFRATWIKIEKPENENSSKTLNNKHGYNIKIMWIVFENLFKLQKCLHIYN